MPLNERANNNTIDESVKEKSRIKRSSLKHNKTNLIKINKVTKFRDNRTKLTPHHSNDANDKNEVSDISSTSKYVVSKANKNHNTTDSILQTKQKRNQISPKKFLHTIVP